MKKIIASAVGLMMVGGVAVTTASAVEHQFGGYWRTRAFSQTDFKVRADQSDTDKMLNGIDNDSSYWRVDTRTRLYYTAKFSDDFKFVNKFEFNTNWGDDNGGNIGTDGTGNYRIKHSYADFTLGSTNTKIGLQGAAIARGFIFDDDFAGAVVTMNFGNVSIPLMWGRVSGEYVSSSGHDQDILSAQAKIKINDDMSITPYFAYEFGTVKDYFGTDFAGNLDWYYLGIDADMNFGGGSFWGTAIWQGGNVDVGVNDVTTLLDQDKAGVLLAFGGSISMVHGQFFYASGDDNGLDGDDDAFTGATGNSYYWAEILGLGTFDNASSNGSAANNISNIWAGNVGVKFKPMDKLTLGGDLWYAALVEDDAYGNDGLGTEIDLKLTYAVMDNLNLDVIGAYLFADDATGQNDPIEIGARLSLKF